MTSAAALSRSVPWTWTFKMRFPQHDIGQTARIEREAEHFIALGDDQFVHRSRNTVRHSRRAAPVRVIVADKEPAGLNDAMGGREVARNTGMAVVAVDVEPIEAVRRKAGQNFGAVSFVLLDGEREQLERVEVNVYQVECVGAANCRDVAREIAAPYADLSNNTALGKSGQHRHPVSVQPSHPQSFVGKAWREFEMLAHVRKPAQRIGQKPLGAFNPAPFGRKTGEHRNRFAGKAQHRPFVALASGGVK